MILIKIGRFIPVEVPEEFRGMSFAEKEIYLKAKGLIGLDWTLEDVLLMKKDDMA